jgi:sarcosine oxidase subunit gamma
MLISNKTISEETNTYEVEDNLIKNISKTKLGAITDVSDQFVMLNIKGSKVFDLLATGSPFNFNEFKNKKGSVTQTILSHIDVIIHLTEINNVNLFVRRSFSEHLHSWLNDSASRL